MISFFKENTGTILTALVLLGIVAAVIMKILRDRKKNKCSGCACGCRGSGQ